MKQKHFFARMAGIAAALLLFHPLAAQARRHTYPAPDLEGAVSPAAAAKALLPYLVGTYPHPRSRYACLIDANNGKVLYQIGADVHREPASLTKIMAATVLLRHGKLSDIVTAPPQVKGVPESSLHLRPGERLSLEDLLYAMLLRSANDTPIAGGTYLAGSVPKFVDMMNQQAALEGCTGTHFVTPNGLYNPNHYSTAHDMARMARYAVLNLPVFDDIVKTQSYRLHRSIDQQDTLVTNTSASYLKIFPGADGIKTGYISQAGHCFVGSATRGGWRLIAVALDSPKCREDVMGMLSYGFAHFQQHLAAPAGTPEGDVTLPETGMRVPVSTLRDLCDIVPSPAAANAPVVNYTVQVTPLQSSQIQMPIHAGDTIGTVTLMANGKPVGDTDAIATRNAAAAAPTASRLGGFGKGMQILGKIAGTVLVSLAAISFAAFATLKIYARASTKNHGRRRTRLAS